MSETPRRGLTQHSGAHRPERSCWPFCDTNPMYKMDVGQTREMGRNKEKEKELLGRGIIVRQQVPAKQVLFNGVSRSHIFDSGSSARLREFVLELLFMT